MREGFVAVADEQTAGYGRRGHVWSSEPGNVYMSVLLRPLAQVSDIQTLGLVAAIAVREALMSFVGSDAARRIKIKWPNDVIVVSTCERQACGSAGEACESTEEACESAEEVPCSDAEETPCSDVLAASLESEALKQSPASLESEISQQSPFHKICGISVELVSGAVCLGIGINIAPSAQSHTCAERNIPASLCELLDAEKQPESIPTRDDVLARVLACFERTYSLWCTSSFSALRETFEEASALTGMHVRVERGDGVVLEQGEVVGVNDKGWLLVANPETSQLAEIADGTIIIGS